MNNQATETNMNQFQIIDGPTLLYRKDYRDNATYLKNLEDGYGAEDIFGQVVKDLCPINISVFQQVKKVTSEPDFILSYGERRVAIEHQYATQAVDSKKMGSRNGKVVHIKKLKLIRKDAFLTSTNSRWFVAQGFGDFDEGPLDYFLKEFSELQGAYMVHGTEAPFGGKSCLEVPMRGNFEGSEPIEPKLKGIFHWLLTGE
jgi:hypothetical protein